MPKGYRPHTLTKRQADLAIVEDHPSSEAVTQGLVQFAQASLARTLNQHHWPVGEGHLEGFTGKAGV
jgi:hypothetical protein